MTYRLDKMINSLRHESVELPAQLKVQIMTAIHADGFGVKKRYVLRYAIGFAAFVIVGTGSTVFAAQGALPGTPLYSVKRASETAYVTVQPSANARLAAQEEIINRRFDEAEKVADSDDNTNTDNDKIEDQLADDAATASDDWVSAQERTYSHDIELASFQE